MSNKDFLVQFENTYDSLKRFTIKGDSMLIFNGENNIMYMLPLNHISLVSMNEKLYLLEAKDIYRILYILELLYKEALNESDIEFINQFTNKYMSLENERLTSNEDELLTYCMGIPIYTSYEPQFENSEASKLIHDRLLEYQTNDLQSNSKGNVLALKPNAPIVVEEEPTDYDLAKSGFATLVLIIGTVLVTTLFVLFFINK